jgi:hypothetical protein
MALAAKATSKMQRADYYIFGVDVIREIVEAPCGRFTIVGEPEFRTDDFDFAFYVADALAQQDEERGRLNVSPKQNWVDKVGGLPDYIDRIAVHLVEKGMDRSRAIATAVNVAKKMCATGDINFPGLQHVNPGSRAEACKAVADWERKKAQAKADNK